MKLKQNFKMKFRMKLHKYLPIHLWEVRYNRNWSGKLPMSPLVWPTMHAISESWLYYPLKNKCTKIWILFKSFRFALLCNNNIRKQGKCLYQVKDMRVLISSFDVFELLIKPFDEGLSVLNFSRNWVFLWF